MANKSIKEESYFKNFQKFLKEDEEVLGTTNVVPLSQVDKDAATAAVTQTGGAKDGNANDDAVSSKSTTVAVKDLKPAQKEIIMSKAFGMAMGMLNSGKWSGVDLESIISADNYIMDGHHRWAAVFLIDPNASIIATQIDLPGKSLVTALNYVTAAKSGLGGNTGQGNVAEFTGAKLATLIDDALANGVKGKFPVSPENVKTLLGKVPGADGDAMKGKEIMMKNADALPKNIMPGAPSRVDMPVIHKSQVKGVAGLLGKGAVDIKPPYSSGVKQALELETIIKTIREQLIAKKQIKSRERAIMIGESALKLLKTKNNRKKRII